MCSRERGLLGRPNYLCFSAYHFKEGGSFSLANHTILCLGELTREGLIGKTKLPLLLRVSLQGKRFFYFSETIPFSGLVNLRKREVHLGNHTTSALDLSLQGRGSFISVNYTILGLGELTQEGGPLGEPYYFRS